MTEGQLFMQSLEDAIEEARQIIVDADKQFGPVVERFALFSGGNDSTTMLHLVHHRLVTPVQAVHINTGWGLQATNDFVHGYAASERVPLRELKTDPQWYIDDVLANGFPQPMTHSIQYHNLKRARLYDLKRETKTHRSDRIMLLTGERAYESQRRMGYGSTTARYAEGFVWVNPIHFFDSRLMNEYRATYQVPRNPVSDLIHRSGECLCMAMMRPEEWDEILLWFPNDPTVQRILWLMEELERRDEVPKHKRVPCWQKLPENRMKPPGPLCVGCSQLWDSTSLDSEGTG